VSTKSDQELAFGLWKSLKSINSATIALSKREPQKMWLIASSKQ